VANNNIKLPIQKVANMNAASCHVDAVAELLFQDGNYTRCVQHLLSKGVPSTYWNDIVADATTLIAGVRDLDTNITILETKINDLETEINAQNAVLSAEVSMSSYASLHPSQRELKTSPNEAHAQLALYLGGLIEREPRQPLQRSA
jgi:hypothetical protein